MNSLFVKIRSQMNSIWFRLLTMCIIPIIFLTSASILIIKYYSNFYYNEIINSQMSSLKNISSTLNNSVYEILQSTHLLAIKPNINDFLYSDGYSEITYPYKTNDIMDMLIKFISSRDCIDDVVMYNKSADYVISKKNVSTATDYFTSIKKYESYNYEHWKNYTSKNQFAIFRPTNVYTDNMMVKTDIMPIVCSGIGNIRSSNLFIINIKTDSLSNIMNNNIPSKNSKLFIIDQQGFSYFGTNSSFNHTPVPDTSLVKRMQDSKGNTFHYTINGEKYVFLSYTPEFTYLKDLTLVAQISVSDITKSSRDVQVWLFILVIIILLICLIISVINTKSFYKPVKILMNLVGKEKKMIDNEFEYLSNQFSLITNTNAQLSHELTTMLPLACEQYIIKALKAYEFYDVEEIDSYLKKNNIPLNLPCFQIAIFSMEFKENFYQDFNKTMQNILYANIQEIIRAAFPKDYVVYVLDLDKNQFCVILNMPQNAEDNNYTHFVKLQNCFNFDKNLLDVFIGIGLQHNDFVGMSESYKEAINALFYISEKESVRLYKPNDYKISYEYPLDTEHKIINFLMSGRESESIELLEEIIKRNQKKNLHTDGLKKLYIRLNITGLDVLTHKKISPDQLKQVKYINLEQAMSYMSTREMLNYVIDFYKAIANLTIKQSKIDIQQIVDYINENYDKDIFLGNLSGMFHTSDKYLSRIIKESLGISFQQYLSNIRISKAKELLKKQKYTVKDISNMVGFNNQNTFLRMFNKLEGITPTQYRKMLDK